ncbi:MAG: SLBB domain-containing protein [Bacteroidetes bacterium]|nr:SLBB domain-containing protein [Bacteroidota bacterium]
MLRKVSLLFFFVFIFASQISAQDDSYQLGSTNLGSRPQGGFFDYSDPKTVNFTVSVWGYVKYPGRYLVPISTSVSDLLSYAGGPNTDAELDDLRIFRKGDDKGDNLIKFTYEDLLWKDNIEFSKRFVPDLQANDILMVPGTQRYFFRDWLSIFLSFLSAISTVVILILNLTKD